MSLAPHARAAARAACLFFPAISASAACGTPARDAAHPGDNSASSSAPASASASAPASASPSPHRLSRDASLPESAHRLRVRLLAPVDAPDAKRPCTSDVADKIIATLGPSCARVPVSMNGFDHTGNGLTPGFQAVPRSAFDGDVCTFWNAGAPPPQSLRATFEIRASADPREANPAVSGVVLVPEMTPQGTATHVLELDEHAFVASAAWVSARPHLVVFERPTHAVHMTVRTVKGSDTPSWVAWREIIPFACTGAPRVPDSAPDVTTSTTADPDAAPPIAERRIPGTGTCKTDGDCVAADCCSPRTCTAKASAPRCAGVRCEQAFSPYTVGHALRCACFEGRCGATANANTDTIGTTGTTSSPGAR